MVEHPALGLVEELPGKVPGAGGSTPFGPVSVRSGGPHLGPPQILRPSTPPSVDEPERPPRPSTPAGDDFKIVDYGLRGRVANEIERARISMVARNTKFPFKGRILMRKTNYLQIVTFDLQHAAGPYRRAMY